MTVCPDALEAELRARRKRQIASRRRALQKRAAKYPLLATQIVAAELAARPDYYNAEPTDLDRGVAAMRLAAREPGCTTPPRAQDYLPDNPAWSRRLIEDSLVSLAYRAEAERLLPPLEVTRIACRLAYLREQWTAYPSSHWHRALVDAGFCRQAWDVHIAHADNPAQERATYVLFFCPRPAVPDPEQLTLPLGPAAV